MTLQDQFDNQLKKDLIKSIKEQIEDTLQWIREYQYTEKNFYPHKIQEYARELELSFKRRLKDIENLMHDYKLVESVDRNDCTLKDVLKLELKYIGYDLRSIHNKEIKDLIVRNLHT